MIASAAFMHSTHVSRTRPIYIYICSVIVWTRSFGALATLLSNSYSVKKIRSSKGGFRGNRGNPPGSATALSETERSCLQHHASRDSV